MVKKNKKNSKKMPIHNEEESMTEEIDTDEKQSGYDSMIDNGTSSSEDGFSDKDIPVSDNDNTEVMKTSKQNKGSKKRKLNEKQENTTAEVAVGSKKQKTSEKVKAPTLDEINELKETRNLFHSNLFRLQVKEMLSELKIKEKYTKYISNWLEQFNVFLKQLKSEPEKQIVDKQHWLYNKCSVQLPLALSKLRMRKASAFEFQFIKPNETSYLTGAAATNTLLGPKIIVDIAVTMPAECFQKDNYLNFIYEQKRACYLTFLTMKMLESTTFLEGLKEEHLNFNYYANNPLKPILELTLPTTAETASIAKKLSFRIFVVTAEVSFKLSRFVPWNNNIRPSFFDEVDELTLPAATPNYNAGVLFDLTMKRNQDLLQEVFSVHKNLQEGLVLLKVWLKQRQLNVGYSGFNNHMMAMFIAYLFKQRKLHNNMSSYQVARTVWNNLAYSAWDESLKGISLCPPTEADVHNQPTLEQFHVYYDVVFIDRTGFYNICANLSSEIYRRVRAESKLVIDTLNNMKLNSFPLIFMEKHPIYAQFDHILKINKSDTIEQILEIYATPTDRCNYAGIAHPQLLKIITKLLRKGLGERINAIIPIEQPCISWSVKEQCKGLQEYLNIGLILHHENALEVLNKGPQSIDEGAEEFRKFWGEKAQLRRFQDGSITEAVVWAAHSDSLAQKRLVVRSIVLHLLKQHLQVENSDVEYLGGEFDVVFKLSPLFKTDKLKLKNPVDEYTDAETTSLNVIRSFDELGRSLNTLSELPLEIVSIAGISPVFRYCDPTPILSQARCVDDKFYAYSVQWGVIQLGLSGKWPGELPALRALKTAFYIQIAKLLREKHHLRTKVTFDGVLVLKHGYVFGIEIAHQKEVVLLKREITERGISKYIDSDASIAIEKRHYILPKVTGILHGLYQTHPSFGGTVMIAKRWLYSQLIDDGLWPDECTELLIANQFLRMPQLVPLQPQTGFFRFLQLLAYTDWKTELILINFNNEMNENEVCDLEKNFNTERESFPPLCIVTSSDLKHYGKVWTSNLRPNVNVLARVTILARQALAIIEPSIASIEEQFIKPSRLFIASHQGYDLVIQLKPELVPNSLAVEFTSPFKTFSKPNFRMPFAGTNFLKDAVAKLRESYSDYAAFFYNPCGGKEIGVIWKPHVFEEKEFKVNEVNGCTLSPDGTKVQCKKEIFTEDFKIILKNFYLRIDTVDVILKTSKESFMHFKQQSKLNNNNKPNAEEKLKLVNTQGSVIEKKVNKLQKKLKTNIKAKNSKAKSMKSKFKKKVVNDVQKNNKKHKL